MSLLQIFLYILSMLIINSHMVTVNHLIISDNPDIIISNYYRFTDILLSNKTKSIISNFTLTTQLNQIPSIKLHYKGKKNESYQQINKKFSFYTIQTLISQEQFQQYVESNQLNESNYDLILIYKQKIKNIGLISNKICPYDNEEVDHEKLKQIVSKCIQNLSIHHEIQYYPEEQQQSLEQKQTLVIFIVTLILFICFSWLKIYYFAYISKAGSIV